MRYFRALAVVVTLAFAGAVSAQGWVEYLDRERFFAVNLPSEPQVEDIQYTSAHDAVFPARVYSVQDGERSYSVTIVDYRDAQRVHAERPDGTEASRNEWIKDIRASVAHEAWNFRKRGGEVTYDAWSDIERVEGHQIQITNPDQSRTYAGIYLNDSRLYVLEANVPAGWPPPIQFQQSLRFFDEEGVRVRYDLDPNGNKTRIPGSYEFEREHSDAEVIDLSSLGSR
ncbi:MAG: hypothetical protein OEQ25_18195 [Gammaproteobacteria bacterium]|nr:hypothetical protein [Gammaproteobacteria bacterium]MDH3509075.1 hypothetical protein [Gammaproteobacteria bacterium]